MPELADSEGKKVYYKKNVKQVLTQHFLHSLESVLIYDMTSMSYKYKTSGSHISINFLLKYLLVISERMSLDFPYWNVLHYFWVLLDACRLYLQNMKKPISVA